MAFWTAFWGLVLLIGLLAFAVLSVLVTFGGFSDIKALFKSIDTQHRDAPDANDG